MFSPQGVWVGLAVVMLILVAYLDGTPRTDKWSLSGMMLTVLLQGLLLWWGGFFNPWLQ